jgi:hypothetical protein
VFTEVQRAPYRDKRAGSFADPHQIRRAAEEDHAALRGDARSTRACLTAHEGNHIISEAMTTIAR